MPAFFRDALIRAAEEIIGYKNAELYAYYYLLSWVLTLMLFFGYQTQSFKDQGPEIG